MAIIKKKGTHNDLFGNINNIDVTRSLWEGTERVSGELYTVTTEEHCG